MWISIKPGARIASFKSTTWQFEGISLSERQPKVRMTPSSISRTGCSICSIGVNNLAAVKAIMRFKEHGETERLFYRKSLARQVAALDEAVDNNCLARQVAAS